MNMRAVHVPAPPALVKVKETAFCGRRILKVVEMVPVVDPNTPARPATAHLFLIANAYWEPLTFDLPWIGDQAWFRFIDTSVDAPQEITEPGRETPLATRMAYEAGLRSVVVLVGK